MREVGRRAGVSHNAPYKHFANKESLLAAVAARVLRRDKLAATLVRDEAPEVAQRGTHKRYAQWAQEYPQHFKLSFGRWTVESDDLARAAQEASQQLVDMLRRDERDARPDVEPRALHPVPFAR